MTKGPAGYGRYDDDPGYVGCPRAKSDMTPCIARDGHLALISIHLVATWVCVGCAHTPEYLAEDLAEGYPPAERLKTLPPDPVALADQFAVMVREATGPGGAEG